MLYLCKRDTNEGQPEEWFVVVNNALTGFIIGVGEEHIPVFWKSFGINSKPMILRGDETAICSFMYAGLVMATITIPEIHKNQWSCSF